MNQTQEIQQLQIAVANLQEKAKTVDKIEVTIYGNGKEGILSILTRQDERLESISDCLKGLPAAIQGTVDLAISNLRTALAEKELDTSPPLSEKDIRVLAQDEIKKAAETPGSWWEFRKLVFPAIVAVISALIGGYLTHLFGW